VRTLSVLIPAYNEERTIAALLDKVAAVRIDGIAKEIIVVNDGSTDRTRALIDEWRTSHTLAAGDRLLVLDKPNGGKGSAVRRALESSTGDVVIVQDADLEYDPNDYAKCIEPILAGRAKVVYGSRRQQNQSEGHSSLAFYLGGVAVTQCFNLLYGSALTDEPTCYKTFDGPLIRALSWSGNRFEWEPEITARLLRLGYDIAEVPIRYIPRRFSEGKKISWRDGVQAITLSFAWRFRPLGRDRAKLSALPGEKPVVDAWRLRVRALWAAILISFIVRLAVSIPGWRTPEASFFRSDSPTYVEPARSMLKNGAYNLGPDSPTPATLRPPGFSALLAGLFAVSGGSLVFPVFVFCFLSALTCWPIFLAGLRLGSVGPAFLAALLFGLNLTSLSSAPLYLSDTLYGFLAAWQYFFFVRLWKQGRLYDVAIAMAFAGIATLVRPTGLPWLVPAAVLILLCPTLTFSKRLIGVAVGTLIFGAFVVPWMWRNDRVGAGFRLETNLGSTLLNHNAATLLSTVTGEPASAIRERFIDETRREFGAHPEQYGDENSRESYQIGRAREVIAQHPLTYARLHVNPWILLPDVATFFEIIGVTETGQGTLDVLVRSGPIAAARHYFKGRLGLLVPLVPALLLVAITYAACAGQVVRWLRSGSWYLLLLFLAFVAYFLVAPGPISMPRYQLPALPMMCVMAGVALHAAWTYWRGNAAKRPAA